MGKELKVVENELSFNHARMVNVFGVFRYKKNNNLYIVYCDVGSEHPVVYYGSSHIKNQSVLCMSCKPEDLEIVKEFIFKVTEKKEYDSFEMISLDDITGIEIITSQRLEIRPEILASLVDLLIPKKEVKEEEKKEKKKRVVL